MKNFFASNKGIYQTLLAIIFSMLCIFSALQFTEPMQVYASEGDSGLSQDPNLTCRDANVSEADTDISVGYRYYNSSSQRCGIMWYVVTDTGRIAAKGLLLDKSGLAEFGNYLRHVNTNLLYPGYGIDIDSSGHTSSTESIASYLLRNADYEPNVSTVYYSGTWKAKGVSVLDYLMEDVSEERGRKLRIDHVEQPIFPRWAALVIDAGNGSLLNSLARPDCVWNVLIEPVTVTYLYTDDTFDSVVDNTMYNAPHFGDGSARPLGEWNSDGSYTPNVYLASARTLLKQSNNLSMGGNDHTFPLYNTQLPFSLCLENDVRTFIYIGGSSGVGYNIEAPASGFSSERLYRNIGQMEGIGVASIDVHGLEMQAIHTYNGVDTPGPPEVPSAENGTTGVCTINKLYYTETLNADGTVDTTASKDYKWYTQSGTTPFISIDAEDGYEIEQWKRSKVNATVHTKESYYNVDYALIGTSTGTQRLMVTAEGNDTYLYVLYKKTEIKDPPAEQEFILEESQITNRVSFVQSEKTLELITHAFKWYSEAHNPTACQAHGGYGHVLVCTTDWDIPPIDGVRHTCTSSCPRACTKVWDEEPVEGVRHIHIIVESLLCSPGCTKTVEEKVVDGRTVEIPHVHQYLNQQ